MNLEERLDYLLEKQQTVSMIICWFLGLICGISVAYLILGLA